MRFGLEHHPALTPYLKTAEFLNDWVFSDVGIGVFDREKFLVYKPGRFMDLGAKVGDQFGKEVAFSG